MSIKNVELFTDGACKNNPGPGGYCAILRYKGNEKIISGGEKDTTNNRMELMAVISGLNALKEPCNVTVYSDSKYFIDSIEKGWLFNWQKNNFIKKGSGKVLNKDLWEKILELISIHNISLVWVKGHSGHIENERCDKIAVLESQKYNNL